MTADVVTELTRLRLLSPGQQRELGVDVAARFPTAGALLEELARRGWLSEYQARQLAAGSVAELRRGPYVLLDPLGEGGMGRVFRARDDRDGRVVALKLLHPERRDRPEAVRRFQREVQAALQLSHPHIVRALEAGEDGETFFLVMEHVAGLDLARLVKRHGPLPVATACDDVRQAALGLQHAHEHGLTHRDVKPSNLLATALAEDRESSHEPDAPAGVTPVPWAGPHRVKVLDLGLARLSGTGDLGLSLTREGAIVGTPDYLAPEQALRASAADVRSDLYGLGCTFFFLLTGRPPFRGESLAEVLLKHQSARPPSLRRLRPDVPDAVCQLVERLLAKDPRDRPGQPVELARALEPFCRADKGSVLLPPRDSGSSGSSSDPSDASREGDAEADRTVVLVHAPSSDGDVPRGPRRRQALALAALLGAAFLLGGWRLTRPGARQPDRVAVTRQHRVEAPPPPAPPVDVARPPVAPPVPPPPPPAKPEAVPMPDVRGPQPAPVQPDPPPFLPRLVPPRADPPPAPLPPPPPPRDAVPRVVGELRRVALGTPVFSLAVSRDGRQALAGAFRLTLVDLERGRTKPCHPVVPPFASCAAFARNGRYAATGGTDGMVRVWHVESCWQEFYFPGHATEVLAVAFSPDGHALLTGGGPIEDREGSGLKIDFGVRLVLRDASDGKELRRFEGHLSDVRAVAFTPDGRNALACDRDTVRLWNVETGRELRRLAGPTGPVNALVVSPDGRLAATAGDDTRVRLWDLGTGRPAGQFAGHTGPVRAVAFSPDGRRLLSGGKDRTVLLWDVGSRRALHRYAGHEGTVTGVAFLGEDHEALSSDLDGTLRVWGLPAPGDEFVGPPRPDGKQEAAPK